ncbi:MAG: MMPL family transporter [Proteobacteria bacterium]|nr:MMPL family transporter [Pseudomonadota bacterium]
MSSEVQKSLANRIADYAVANRKRLFVISTLLTILLATGILRTSFDTSLNALLTQSDPYLDELELLAEEFPSDVEIYFAFVAEDNNHVFTHEMLSAIEDLGERYNQLPFARSIISLVDYIYPETQRRLFVKPIAEYTQDELDAMVSDATADRILTANLLSTNAELSFAIINLDADSASNPERLEIADAVLLLRDEMRGAHPTVSIQANSDVLLEQSSQQAMIDDLTTLLPIVILICVLTICYCFKSAILGVCILAHTIFALLCTVGALGYLGFAFNTISIIAPLVVVIISVANSVHIISIYKQALHKNAAKTAAMRHSVAYNFQPITLAALTTAIGFSSLNMCSSPAIQDFGRIVAIGIGFAYLLTITLLPALLIQFAPVLSSAAAGRPPFLQNSLQKLIDLTQRRDKAIFWFCSALALVTFLLLPLNETDFNRLDFIATDSDIKQYYDDVTEKMNRGPALSYGIDTEISDGGIQPDFLRDIDGFVNWLDNQPDVESVASIAEIVKTVGRVANQNDATFFRIPDTSESVGNYLNAYRLVETEDFSLAGFINRDNSLITLFVNATPMSNQELIDLDQRITEKFGADFPELEFLHGSGILLFARMDELVTIELLQGYSISLLLITLSLIVGLRSVYFGILSVLPNLLPATIVFGVWALFVGQLDPFVMMLFSISIGLVVDDTVHILSHYLEGRRSGVGKTDSINHAIRVAGPALTITTLVLALGTTILIGANTLYFQQAAKLLVPIVILALVLDLLYLPTILKRFDNRLIAGVR